MGQEGQPETVGGYRILARLGQGGMGAVYRAKHPRTGAEVALKVMLPQYATREDVRLRFQREVRAMAAVEHPNLVRILEAGEDQGLVYYTMQLVDGVDLAARIAKKGRLPPQTVRGLGLGMLSALEALHAVGVVHRDLKPHNVMVDRTGRPLIMDFGLVHVEDAKTLTKTGALIGSPRYMSPEILTGRPLDGRSDVYQVGLILWECATGETAVGGDDFPTVSSRILTGTIPDLLEKVPDFPPHLAEIVHRCMAVEPEDRFHSASEAHAVLEGREPMPPPGPREPALPTSPGTPAPPPMPLAGLPGPSPRPSPLATPLGRLVVFLACFAAGYQVTAPRPRELPFGVDVQGGIDRAVVSWSGGRDEPVQALALGPGGERFEVPPGGPALVPADADGRSKLVVEGLRPGTEYQVILRWRDGGTAGTPIRTPAAFLDGHRARLAGGEPGRLRLELDLPVRAEVEVRYPRQGGGTGTVGSPEATSHRVELPELDAAREGSGLQVEVTDPIGGRVAVRLALGDLLAAGARRFLAEVGEAQVERTVDRLARAFWNGTEGLAQKFREAMDESGILPHLAEIGPLAGAVLANPDLEGPLRVAMVSRLEELRRIERCLSVAAVPLEPSPSSLLAGPYALRQDPGTTFSDSALLGKSVILAGARDLKVDQSRTYALKVKVPRVPDPPPALGRVVVEVPGALGRDRHLRVDLPGGLRFYVFDDATAADPGREGHVARTFLPSDLPAGGGEAKVTYDDNFRGAVAGEVRFTKLLLGYSRPGSPVRSPSPQP